MVAMGKRVTEIKQGTEPGKRPRGRSDSDMDHDVSLSDEEAGIMNGEEVHELGRTHESIVPITPAAKDYSRPPLNMNASRDLVFQWTDIDMAGELPYDQPPDTICPKDCKLDQHRKTTENTTPVVRLYGVTAEGNSVFAHTHGFLPYFYIQCPRGFLPQHRFALRHALSTELRNSAGLKDDKLKEPCLGVDYKYNQASVYGYNFNNREFFLIIELAMPSLVNKARAALCNGIVVKGFGNLSCGSTYDSNVPYVLRFMVDAKLQGASWLTLPGGSYSMRSDGRQVSRCQAEVDVYFKHIIAHEPEGEWSKIAPLRVLSFDIECAGRKGSFPEAEKDSVIQIANQVQVLGETEILVSNVFTLKGCSSISGAEVLSTNDESTMLANWAEFVKVCDPDIITGYNIQNFDVPYLLRRAAALSKDDGNRRTLGAFCEWGRLKGIKCSMRDTSFQSSAYGKRESVETTIHGRVMFDMLPYMFRNHKLSSYSLNNVSAEFLGQQKEDVHHSIIADLQNGSDEDRRRLAVYCLKDAYLPLLLMEKLCVLVNQIEMARVSGVPISFLLSRGQQIKVFSMLLRKCNDKGLRIPNLPKKKGPDDTTYEGATVIDPIKAFYDEPIATLDFASLYPSIMQAHNLCYSTLVSKQDISRLNESQYIKTPSGDYFVTSGTCKGILPEVLDELLTARKKAKKDMATATDPLVKAVQNGRQLALKISANSVYGFTGAIVGHLPCVPIASSTTSIGRDLLLQTKKFVETHFTVANNYPADAQVVYGDTDSVMVKFGVHDVVTAMPLAEEAAKLVSAEFPSPIKLEFEKVYMPYLLMNKKRYAGLLWTNAEKYDKMDTKGLETVRRDNCMLVRIVVETCLHKILVDRDVEGAISYSKEVISQLLQDKIDISLLVITKSLGKGVESEDYVAKQAHVELAMRMKKRDPGSAPSVGDRVPYVITQGAKGDPAYERSEDPVYVLENNIPIDTSYYLTNQLIKPLNRLFEPVIDDVSKLLTGDHTRTVVKKTPTARPGGILMFTKQSSSCLGCKAVVPQGENLCQHCLPNVGGIYAAKLGEMNRCQVWAPVPF